MGEAKGALTRQQMQERAAQGFVWTLIHTAVSLPLAFVVNIFLGRVLGVEDYGRLALLTTVMGLAGAVLVSGVDSAMIQFGAKAHAAGRESEVRELLSRVQGFRLLVLAPVSSALVVWLAEGVPWVLVVSALVFGVWIPASLSGAKVCLTLEQRTATDAKIHIVANLIQQAVVVVVLLLLASAETVWTARMGVGGLAVIMALPWVSKNYRRAVVRPRWPWKLPRAFWRFAIPTGAGALVSTMAMQRTEIFFLEWFADPAAVGLFAMSFGFAAHLLAPAQALINPLVPAISGLREVDLDMVGDAAGRVVRITTSFGGLVAVGVGPAMALLSPLLYGHEYEEAPPLIIALLFSSLILFVTYPLQAFAEARLQGGSILKMNVVALLVSLVVVSATILFLGVWAAVASKFAVALARFTYLIRFENASLHMSTKSLLRNSTPLLLSGSAIVAGFIVGQELNRGVFVAAVASSIVSLVVYLLLLRVLRAGISPRDERAMMHYMSGRIAPLFSPALRLVTHARD